MEYQQTIFDFLYETKKINKPIRLIELFAGIGSQAKALKNIGVNFTHYKVVEFDQYAINSYNAIHNTNFKTLDITKIDGKDLEIIDTDKYEYIMTYSFPCQDLSLAGNQKGMSKDSNTRSGLLWEVERILYECCGYEPPRISNGRSHILDNGITTPRNSVVNKTKLPQILLMENVPMIHSKDNIHDFNQWINVLEKLGYKNYWKDLNAKHYGIPQNRNRTFMISVLGDYNYVFPTRKKLKLRLKDTLEDCVDESYYLSEDKIKSIQQWKSYQNPLDNILTKDSISPTLTARGAGEEHSGMILYTENEYVGTFRFSQSDNFMEGKNRFTENNNVSDTILTSPKQGIVIKEATQKGYAVAGDGDGVYINRPHQKRGVVQKGMIQTLKTQCDDVGVVVLGNYSQSEHNASRIVDIDGIAPTVMENHGTVTAIENLFDLRIRKLTPKECFRLMGFSDEDYQKASLVNTKTQLYKQAGNSIVVNVLEEIFKQLF